MKTVQDIMRENDTERKIADFRTKQKQDYAFKRQYMVDFMLEEEPLDGGAEG